MILRGRDHLTVFGLLMKATHSESEIPQKVDIHNISATTTLKGCTIPTGGGVAQTMTREEILVSEVRKR